MAVATLLWQMALAVLCGGARALADDAHSAPLAPPPPLVVTRRSGGDLFAYQNPKKQCTEETCIGLSSGTATADSDADFCKCKCHPHVPTFREDLRICVDDINECILAPFVGGSTSQQIPFVFLPLKGQIIHPSKEIYFSGIRTPVCAISGAKYLSENGWLDLRNPLDTDVPFRLFRDEGKTFVQWVGEPELRNRMSGRVIIVYLMCRDLSSEDVAPTIQTIFSPCVAFRVVGTPSQKMHSSIQEVTFSSESESDSDASTNDSLSISEYVAIGICSVILGLIYVASIFFYLHLKKRNSSNIIKKGSICNKSLATVEEGVIKSNPLLTLSHFPPTENPYSDTNSSENETAPDIIQHHDDRRKNIQIQALIHCHQQNSGCGNYQPYHSFSSYEHQLQESSGIEKLPEENVSIVETLEAREDRPENLRAITGTPRKKLYFNPAYFEPHLLVAPPPAALEFLSKIREVISIAKQKLSTRRFVPSLLNIPEEDNESAEHRLHSAHASPSRRGSAVSLKRGNSRRRDDCPGCPGCERDCDAPRGRLPSFPAFGACQTCITPSAADSKQHSIRKWLEDVPILKSTEPTKHSDHMLSPKRLRSPARSLPPESVPPERALSPRPSSEKGSSPSKQNTRGSPRVRNEKIRKPTCPPPPAPVPPKQMLENYYDTVPADDRREMSHPPPDMIHEAMVVDRSGDVRIPTLTKKQMNAVINELTVHRNLIIANNPPPQRIIQVDYDTDSLERAANKGYSTPSEYAEVSSSSQPSPSLSTALPVEEEITMRNAIFNKNTGSMTISKINMDSLTDGDDHDYELIVMKKGTGIADPSLYKLPELLQRKNDYSLVSEVYVNNGYNYGSTPTTPAESNCSTLERKTLKIRYDGGCEKPGKLLIEVEDCADLYIPVHDSDEFEPDTLDRKPVKSAKSDDNNNEQPDSTDKPANQILLRTTGSFKNNSAKEEVQQTDSGSFTRVFGSLREIYEAKAKSRNQDEDLSLNSISSSGDDEGKLLTLEERHSKRQRVKTKGPVVQPDVIPPPPHDNSPIYERPKPPRKIVISDDNVVVKPPIPPKNGNGRSAIRGGSRRSETTLGTPDYELCLLQKSKKNGDIINLIQTEDLVLKRNGEDQFVLHNNSRNLPVRFPLRRVETRASGRKKPPARRPWPPPKPDDSGYLSTDSADESRQRRAARLAPAAPDCASETDESPGDAQSESGAESVETHSVFFGSFRRQPDVYAAVGSVDSGVTGGAAGSSDSDSETVSYTTVVPVL